MSAFSTRFWWHPLESRNTDIHITLESEIIVIGVLQSHETWIHNITLESKIILIGVLLSHETRIHNIALKYYD